MSKVKIELKLVKKESGIKSYRLFINKRHVFYYDVKKRKVLFTDDEYYLLTSFIQALDSSFGKEVLDADEFYGCDGSKGSRQYLYNKAHEMMINKYLVTERMD